MYDYKLINNTLKNFRSKHNLNIFYNFFYYEWVYMNNFINIKLQNYFVLLISDILYVFSYFLKENGIHRK